MSSIIQDDKFVELTYEITDQKSTLTQTRHTIKEVNQQMTKHLEHTDRLEKSLKKSLEFLSKIQ